MHKVSSGNDLFPLKTSNFFQFLVRIVTRYIYLFLCGFNECFKTIGFFKMPQVTYITNNERILEDLMEMDFLLKNFNLYICLHDHDEVH